MFEKILQRLRDHQIAAWSLGAAFLAFLPILIGIWTANPEPPARIYFVAVIAGAVAGVLTGVKTHIDEKSVKGLTEAVAEMRAAKDQLERERADTQYALSAIGSGVAAIVLKNDEETVVRFINTLLKLVHDTLGESRGPRRVFFLRNHQELIGGHRTGENSAFSVLGSTYGHCGSGFTWDIPLGSQDAQVALDLLVKRPPWSKGSLLVADVTQPAWSRYAVLAPPDQGKQHDQIKCWYRIAVIGLSTPFGILGIDAWEANAISSGTLDENFGESFSALLAAGLLVHTRLDKIITDCA